MEASMVKLPYCKKILLKVHFVFSFDYMQERRALLTALLSIKDRRKRRVRRGMLLYFILPKCKHLERKFFSTP